MKRTYVQPSDRPGRFGIYSPVALAAGEQMLHIHARTRLVVEALRPVQAHEWIGCGGACDWPSWGDGVPDRPVRLVSVDGRPVPPDAHTGGCVPWERRLVSQEDG